MSVVDELLDLVLTTSENAKHYKKVADKKALHEEHHKLHVLPAKTVQSF